MDTLAALLDFDDTRELWRAVHVGEAPPPSAIRRGGRQEEPVWALQAVTEFVRQRHLGGIARSKHGIEDLVPDDVDLARMPPPPIQLDHCCAGTAVDRTELHPTRP